MQKEGTYPGLIKWFLNFDKKVMMPIFKKKFDEKESEHEGGDSEDEFTTPSKKKLKLKKPKKIKDKNKESF